MAIEAGDVLVVGARQGLLGLHHFDAVGDACRKAVFGTSDVVVSQPHIPMSDVNLLPGGIQVEKCGAHVVINLPADVFCFRLSLAQSRFRLDYVALDSATGVDGTLIPAWKLKIPWDWPNVGPGRRNRHSQPRRDNVRPWRQTAPARLISPNREPSGSHCAIVSHREGVFDGRRMDVRIGKLVRSSKVWPRGNPMARPRVSFATAKLLRATLRLYSSV